MDGCAWARVIAWRRSHWVAAWLLCTACLTRRGRRYRSRGRIPPPSPLAPGPRPRSRRDARGLAKGLTRRQRRNPGWLRRFAPLALRGGAREIVCACTRGIAIDQSDPGRSWTALGGRGFAGWMVARGRVGSRGAEVIGSTRGYRVPRASRGAAEGTDGGGSFPRRAPSLRGPGPGRGETPGAWLKG